MPSGRGGDAKYYYLVTGSLAELDTGRIFPVPRVPPVIAGMPR